MTTDYEQSAGRFILRCDTATFERLRDAVCREGGVFVPVSVPPTPLREIVVALAANAPPPRTSWWRHVVVMIILLLILAGPVGLYAIVAWLLK
jgi:hypothetical protein